MAQDKNMFNESTSDYLTRIQNRTGTLGESTMVLLQKLMDDGDDYATAKGKVQSLSDEISAGTPSAKMDFTFGSIQPLKDQVNASALSFMTANNGANKTIVIDILDQAV